MSVVRGPAIASIFTQIRLTAISLIKIAPFTKIKSSNVLLFKLIFLLTFLSSKLHSPKLHGEFLF